MSTSPTGLERFEFRGKLGQGGMGVVYRVFDRELKREVALKTLPQADAEAIYRFKREFRSLAELSHRNLISLYELFSENDTWYFTMEYVEGTNFLAYVTLADSTTDDATQAGSKAQATTDDATVAPRTRSDTRTEADLPAEPVSQPELSDAATPAPAHVSLDATVQRSGEHPAFDPSRQAPTFVLARLVDALRQLALGVQALHDAGREHRDLKPANVMVGKDGRVVLLDFGLALDRSAREFYEDTSEVGSTSGTPAYMAPERHLGQPASFASDWYAVGVMLYQALTGFKPYLRLADVIAGVPPPHPTEQNPLAPPELADLAMALLLREPGQRPSGVEILRRLGVQRVDSKPAAVAAPRLDALVGREAHLATLQSAFEDMKLNGTVQMHVQGRSGFGKTALILRFLEGLMASGDAVVLAGRCYERESVPYKVFDSLVDSLTRFMGTLKTSAVKTLLPDDVRVLTRLFPALLRLPAVAEAPQADVDVKDAQELARRAASALKALLVNLAKYYRLVLFVDDLQWGDADSSRLLAELLSAPPPKLLLVVSFRSEDLKTSPVLAQLLEATESSGLAPRRLEVGPLSSADSTTLAKNLLGAQASAHAERLTTEAAGSPFFVQQLAQYLSSSPDAAAGAAQLTLAQVLEANVRHLPEPSQRLLRSVSVAGHPISRAFAAQAAGLGDDTAEAFGGLRVGNWVRVSGPRLTDTIEPYHDKIRETLVAAMGVEQVQELHRRLAELFEAQEPKDPEALTLHWLGAGQPQKASTYVLEAAQLASRTLAFERAAELFQQALDTLPKDSPRRHEAQAGLAEALKNAGKGAEAAEAYLVLARGAADQGERLELERRAFEQYLVTGYLEKGRDLAQRVVRSVGLSLPQSRLAIIASLLYRRARVTLRGRRFVERTPAQLPRAQLTRIDVCWSMAVGLSLMDNALGADFTARFLMEALDGGEPERLSRALSLEAAHQGGAASFRKAEALLDEAEVLAKRCDSPHSLGLYHQNRAWVEYFQGRYASALWHYDESSRVLRAQCTGVAWEISTAEMMASWSLVYLGEWKELQRRFPPLMAEARQMGNLYRMDGLGICAGVVSGLAQDQVDRVRDDMREGAERWNPSGFQLQHFFRLLMRGWVDLYDGRADTYWPHLKAQWKPLQESLLMTVVEIKYRMYLVRGFTAAALARSVRPMRREALRCAKVLASVPSTGALGLASTVRAAVLHAEGKSDEAITQLKVAIDDFAAAGMALYGQAAKWRMGQLLGPETGGPLVHQAQQVLAAQGIARPDKVVRLLAPGFEGAPQLPA